MFFDDYPAFYDSSRTAAIPRRLNLRHQAIIRANRDILRGARVLDLASHDGRWAFAALKAGAAHVTAVEARPSLVDNARAVFEAYGVAPASYDLVQGDMFRYLASSRIEADVVLCLGFAYHTLRYGELFRGIAATGARHCVLDTKVAVSDEPVTRVLTNKTGVQSSAAKDDLSQGGLALAGYPSVPALHLMLGVYGYEVEEQFDWAALLASRRRVRPTIVRGYSSGERVTLRYRKRGAGPVEVMDETR